MADASRSLAAARRWCAAALAIAVAASGSPAFAGPGADDAGGATIVLVARSIGSKRGERLDPRSHAALLVRFDGRPGGFIVQGGKEAVPGGIFMRRHRVVGWTIPAQDPAAEFAVAVGGYWGESEPRALPTRELARFKVAGLTEARLRELVEELNQELRDRDYRLESGPSSNSFVSRLLDLLGLPLPPLDGERLPGWGWR
jgi:hypothetical protein